jgi:hypothetical protein
MPEVLSGTQPGYLVDDIIRVMADLLGYNTGNTRFSNACKDWINDTLREMQLADPHNRRTIVHDAPAAVIADTHTYDVRDTEENGGFGWDNCFEVLALVIPEISTRPLEPLSIDQYRNRSFIQADSGPPYGWVMIDQFRVRFVPTPSEGYTGAGDYVQDIPKITSGQAKIDWPRAWDSILSDGVKYRGMEWQYTEQPGVWKTKELIYRERIKDWKMHDASPKQRPRKVVVTRALRSNRATPRDNSTDRRFWGY